MYTNLNICALFAYPWVSERIRDIIRASTFVILITVITIWLTQDMSSLYSRLYDSFSHIYLFWLPDIIRNTMPPVFKQGLFFMGDALYHIIPPLIVGLPVLSSSIVIASAIFASWYMVFRKQIYKIYTAKIDGDFVIGMGAFLALCYALLLCFL